MLLVPLLDSWAGRGVLQASGVVASGIPPAGVLHVVCAATPALCYLVAYTGRLPAADGLKEAHSLSTTIIACPH